MFSKKIAIVGAALALICNLTIPNEARAFMLLTLSSPSNYFGSHEDANPKNWGTADVILCVVFLPLCALGENVQAGTVPEQQELSDSGYTQEQIKEITDQSIRFAEILIQRGQKIELTAADTAETIAKGVREISPDASQLFIDYLVGKARGLKKDAVTQ